MTHETSTLREIESGIYEVVEDGRFEVPCLHGLVNRGQGDCTARISARDAITDLPDPFHPGLHLGYAAGSVLGELTVFMGRQTQLGILAAHDHPVTVQITGFVGPASFPLPLTPPPSTVEEEMYWETRAELVEKCWVAQAEEAGSAALSQTITLGELGALCKEYDRNEGEYPEHAWEGWAVWQFIRARLAKEAETAYWDALTNHIEG